ncbi:MAG: AMP-dependent synthetase/ligase, partial [Ignavibacteriales bacterium]
EWAVADLATLSCAGVDAMIYPTNSAPEAAYIIVDSESVVCFCEGKFQVDNLLTEKDKLPSLKKIIVFDDPGYTNEHVISYQDAIKTGQAKLQTKEISKRRSSIKGSDLMTLIYSSGTTGQPKGVMLSHSNIMFIVLNFNMQQNLPEGHTILSLLPLSHAVERTMDYYSTMMDGGIIAYSRGTEFFAQELTEIRPYLGIYVPRLFEKMYNGINAKVKTASAAKQKLFQMAVAAGKDAAPYFMANKPLPGLLSIRYKFFDKLLFSKLRETLGLDQCMGFGAAGAPLIPEIHDFFWGMGIQVRKGYGLTETSPVLNVDGDPRLKPIKSDGWITPFPDTEVKIAEDGEILVKGPQIMLGYLNKPEATKEMFTEDGWLKTGDIGLKDNEGYVKITDRKKDIIITAGGKNVAPQVLENTFASHPMIEQITVLGDGKKYIVALIVPDFIALESWAATEGLGDLSREQLVRNQKVEQMYQDIIENINQRFGRVEQIKKFRLMSSEFTQENGELTPTLKLKRKVIAEKYKAEVEALYIEN